MSFGDDPADRLAYDLSESSFDAVERDGLRAEWVDEGRHIAVTDPETDEPVLYDAEDLVRATSDTEVRNAREPEDIE